MVNIPELDVDKKIDRAKRIGWTALSAVLLCWLSVVWQDLLDKRIIKFEPYLNRAKIALYEEVRSKADTNHDGLTDDQEWKIVYDRFGMPYDVHLSNPRYELSKRQMRDFLGK